MKEVVSVVEYSLKETGGSQIPSISPEWKSLQSH